MNTFLKKTINYSMLIGYVVYIILLFEVWELKGWQLLAALVIPPTLFSLYFIWPIIMPSIYQVESVIWGKPIHTFKKGQLRNIKLKPKWGKDDKEDTVQGHDKKPTANEVEQ